jgi:ArsR family transcriptional regulator
MIESNQFFDVLADETRRRVLLLLLKSKERCVCEIFQVLDLPQPKVSRHLAIMREAGLLAARKEGTWVHYRINPQLPLWAARVIEAMAEGLAGTALYASDAGSAKVQANGTTCCV